MPTPDADWEAWTAQFAEVSAAPVEEQRRIIREMVEDLSGSLQKTEVRKKKGRLEVWALCPFHHDTEVGSFSIRADSGGFFCFVCGARGYLPQLMRHLGVWDADRAQLWRQVDLSMLVSPEADPEGEELLEVSPSAVLRVKEHRPLLYLHRGHSRQVLDHFEVGLFEGRAIFPVRCAAGWVVGFQTREIAGGKRSIRWKWLTGELHRWFGMSLNFVDRYEPPRSTVFYGEHPTLLHLAGGLLGGVDRPVTLAEGLGTVLRMWSAGQPCMGSFGTQLGAGQLTRMRYALESFAFKRGELPHLRILADGDRPGIVAALERAELFQDVAHVTVAPMEDGLDGEDLSAAALRRLEYYTLNQLLSTSPSWRNIFMEERLGGGEMNPERQRRLMAALGYAVGHAPKVAERAPLVIGENAAWPSPPSALNSWMRPGDQALAVLSGPGASLASDAFRILDPATLSPLSERQSKRYKQLWFRVGGSPLEVAGCVKWSPLGGGLTWRSSHDDLGVFTINPTPSGDFTVDVAPSYAGSLLQLTGSVEDLTAAIERIVGMAVNDPLGAVAWIELGVAKKARRVSKERLVVRPLYVLNWSCVGAPPEGRDVGYFNHMGSHARPAPGVSALRVGHSWLEHSAGSAEGDAFAALWGGYLRTVFCICRNCAERFPGHARVQESGHRQAHRITFHRLICEDCGHAHDIGSGTDALDALVGMHDAGSPPCPECGSTTGATLAASCTGCDAPEPTRPRDVLTQISMTPRGMTLAPYLRPDGGFLTTPEDYTRAPTHWPPNAPISWRCRNPPPLPAPNVRMALEEPPIDPFSSDSWVTLELGDAHRMVPVPGLDLTVITGEPRR